MATTSTNERAAYAWKSAPGPKPGGASAEVVEGGPNFHGLTGRSPAMRQLMLQMERMAPHLGMAMIEGGEGTGKTLAARALHAAGPAAEDGPFIPCLASYFFANPEARSPAGWSLEVLRQAQGGMLFLDRVHQLSDSQQDGLAEFLHWFEDQQYVKKQEAAARRPDGVAPASPVMSGPLPRQVLFSTSIPLWHSHDSSFFREDVASRLCAVRFRLPPLTERREDIPLLAQIFIQRFSREYGKPVRGLGPGTIAPLLRYGWPGNVAELESVITAAALETESQWIRPIDLPPLPLGPRRHLHEARTQLHISDNATETELNLDCAIRSHVGRVLRGTRGNKLRAAQLLGISRSTLYRILAAKQELPI